MEWVHKQGSLFPYKKAGFRLPTLNLEGYKLGGLLKTFFKVEPL